MQIGGGDVLLKRADACTRYKGPVLSPNEHRTHLYQLTERYGPVGMAVGPVLNT